MKNTNCDIKKLVDELTSSDNIEKTLQGILVKCSSVGVAKKKRKPSAYNVFIGKCMKDDKLPMKNCSDNWKTMSSDEQQKYKPSD